MGRAFRTASAPVVDKEFKAMIPPLDEQELKLLTANVIREGCIDALKVWRWKNSVILLDGHNRLEICTKYRLPYEVQEVEGIACRNDAIMWILSHQLGRRNLTDVVRVRLALRLQPMMAEKAAQKRKEGNAKGGRGKSTAKPADDLPTSTPVETMKDVAKLAGVCTRKAYQIQRVIKDGAPELVKAIESDSLSTSAAETLLDLPKDEQVRLVEEGAAAEVAKEILRMKRKPPPVSVAPVQPDSEPPPSSPRSVGRPRSDDVVKREEQVKELYAQGLGTGDIAKAIGCDAHRVSEAKTKLGLGRKNGNPFHGRQIDVDAMANVLFAAWELHSDRWMEADATHREDFVKSLRNLRRATSKLINMLCKSEGENHAEDVEAEGQ